VIVPSVVAAAEERVVESVIAVSTGLCDLNAVVRSFLVLTRAMLGPVLDCAASFVALTEDSARFAAPVRLGGSGGVATLGSGFPGLLRVFSGRNHEERECRTPCEMPLSNVRGCAVASGGRFSMNGCAAESSGESTLSVGRATEVSLRKCSGASRM
jgi:hypothetical protein